MLQSSALFTSCPSRFATVSPINGGSFLYLVGVIAENFILLIQPDENLFVTILGTKTVFFFCITLIFEFAGCKGANNSSSSWLDLLHPLLTSQRGITFLMVKCRHIEFVRLLTVNC